ncbi:MAG: Lrp/AsnC family transcriptional regulator [Pseudomonadota bacterium]
MTAISPIDAKILRALEDNGRLTNIEVARKVGLSPSACSRRVHELERLGIIKGYRAVLDPQKTGQSFIAYVTVGLSEHSKEAQAEFERAMIAALQVRECHNITGAVEYILRVHAEDLSAYKHFHTEVLGTVPGVRLITSYIVMGSPKDERG